MKWTKNGKEIKANENLVLESLPDGIHHLTLKNAQADQAGQYIANVKHKVRTQPMVFNVIVTGILKDRVISISVNEDISNSCM